MKVPELGELRNELQRLTRLDSKTFAAIVQNRKRRISYMKPIDEVIVDFALQIKKLGGIIESNDGRHPLVYQELTGLHFASEHSVRCELHDPFKCCKRSFIVDCYVTIPWSNSEISATRDLRIRE